MQASQRNQITQGRMQISQRNQNTQGRRIVQEERQEIQKTYQTRTQNTYVVKENQRVVSPRRIEATRTTNYNLNRDLNRQAAGNTAAKNQVPIQARSRGYGYDSNVYQSQDRSSREGEIYHYEPVSRRDFQGNNNNVNRERRGRVVSSVESGQHPRTRYTQIRNENYQVNQNRVYVSGSPGNHRSSHNEEEGEYHSNIRGGIVRFKRWKYTTQTEINKIIMIQRWWRYVMLMRRGERHSLSESNEQKSEQGSDNIIRYEENERYGSMGGENFVRTETKLKRNQKEKIIEGTKNRYIVETTTIEVYKNQSTFLKKVEPEELTKETKKIKRKTIKEKMLEIWANESVQCQTDQITLISNNEEKITQIVEEYEYKMEELKTFIKQKEEEIVSFQQTLEKMKTFHDLNIEGGELKIISPKKPWNEVVKEKKETKFTYQRQEKTWTEIEIIEMLYKMRKPLLVQCVGELEILKDQKPDNVIEERDSLVILSAPKEPLKFEYIDEIVFDGEQRPENEIQLIDQMEILKTEKPENEIENIEEFELLYSQHKWVTIPSDEDKINIKAVEKPENEIEERDQIIIDSVPKEPLQPEYIDEIIFDGENRPENEVQLIDQMEILKEEKPENEVENINEFELLPSRKWTTEPSQNDTLFIKSQDKPNNEVELTNEVEILGQEKPENEVEERDQLVILSQPKEPLQTENIDELFLPAEEKPENENIANKKLSNIMNYFSFNRIQIINIFYDADKLINIDLDMIQKSDLSDYFYLTILIEENKNIVTFIYSIDLIEKIDNKIMENNDYCFRNLIK